MFDVGANRGQFRDFLRQEVGYAGLIVSVEPLPDLASEIKQRSASDPLWKVMPCALGRVAGTLTFNRTRNTEFSSFLQPKGAHHGIFKGSDEVTDRVQVLVRTLDEVYAETQLAHPFTHPYLKLDTQGFDLEVVGGASSTLSAFVALQTEASVQPIYEQMPGYQSTIERLGAAGFVPSAFFPNNEGHFPELIEFDCHLVNKEWTKRLRDRDRHISSGNSCVTE